MKFFFEFFLLDDMIEWFDIKDFYLLLRDKRLVNFKLLVFMNFLYYEWIYFIESDFDILLDIIGIGYEIL